MLQCILGKLGYLKNEGTSVWNFVPDSGLRKFLYGTPNVGKCDINSDTTIDLVLTAPDGEAANKVRSTVDS